MENSRHKKVKPTVEILCFGSCQYLRRYHFDKKYIFRLIAAIKLSKKISCSCMSKR